MQAVDVWQLSDGKGGREGGNKKQKGGQQLARAGAKRGVSLRYWVTHPRAVAGKTGGRQWQ